MNLETVAEWFDHHGSVLAVGPYRQQVRVTMGGLPPKLFLAMLSAGLPLGKTLGDLPHTTYRQKTKMRIMWHGRAAGDVLRLLLPFLEKKRIHAQLGLSIISRMTLREKWRLSSTESEIRTALGVHLGRLNQGEATSLEDIHQGQRTTPRPVPTPEDSIEPNDVKGKRGRGLKIYDADELRRRGRKPDDWD